MTPTLTPPPPGGTYDPIPSTPGYLWPQPWIPSDPTTLTRTQDTLDPLGPYDPDTGHPGPGLPTHASCDPNPCIQSQSLFFYFCAAKKTKIKRESLFFWFLYCRKNKNQDNILFFDFCAREKIKNQASWFLFLKRKRIGIWNRILIFLGKKQRLVFVVCFCYWSKIKEKGLVFWFSSLCPKQKTRKLLVFVWVCWKKANGRGVHGHRKFFMPVSIFIT